MSLPQCKILSRDRLFYEQFEYCLHFRLKSVNLLRQRDLVKMDQWIERRNGWSLRYAGQRYDIITAEDRQNLVDMHHRLTQLTQGHKCIFSMHWAYIYASDLNQLAAVIDGAQGVSQLRLTRVEVNRPRDVVLTKHAPHPYRTYFRERMFRDRDQGEKFVRFLQRQSNLHMSRSLDKATRYDKFFYLQRHHYVEHDHHQDTMVLALHSPGLIRKTCPVRAK